MVMKQIEMEIEMNDHHIYVILLLEMIALVFLTFEFVVFIVRCLDFERS